MRTGTFWDAELLRACGGRKRLKPISQLVVVAAWLSLRSLPPKEAIVAFVVTDIVCVRIWGWLLIEDVAGGRGGIYKRW